MNLWGMLSSWLLIMKSSVRNVPLRLTNVLLPLPFSHSLSLECEIQVNECPLATAPSLTHFLLRVRLYSSGLCLLTMFSNLLGFPKKGSKLFISWFLEFKAICTIENIL